MSYRSHVNTVLRRATGYELRKPPTPKQAAPKKPASKPAAPTSAKPANTRAQRVPKDFDETMADIVRAVLPYTMTSFDKLHATITATRYVARYDVPGDIVECGVWRGGSMHAIARTLDSVGVHDRDLYLYDTFEGMTEPTEDDVRHDGSSAATALATQDKDSMVWAVASLDDVQEGFATVPYPKERVHYVKGPVEETVPATMPERIAMLRLDTDWYASTAHELTHMYDRLVSGGVLVIDDYGHWQGSRKATDEFLERTGERLLLVRTGSGRIAVKP
ncbi:TylF/MycF/NovP-related O-methyltransferase [uncultured Jatrophihabitans sp.]|uniref:TylF/MycF/NovP-related O-methyltransferase n=1 Tax=uncultured Jatrophihabitans sp. TaxID=1610747 RepID=UPI0035CC94F5